VLSIDCRQLLYNKRFFLLYALFWVIHRGRTFRNTVCSIFLGGTYEDGTECSETVVFKLQTPVNHPEDNIQHSEHGEHGEHGESFKSRMFLLRNQTCKQLLWPSKNNDLCYFRDVDKFMG
jgi:hypothetical protein